MKARPPVRLAKHLAQALHAGRCAYRKRLECCREKPSGRHVHALRVQTRRLLALLGVLDEIGFRDEKCKASHILLKRLKAFGDLRDNVVQQNLLETLLPRHPEARLLKTFLDNREKRLTAKLKSKLERIGCSGLNARLKKIESALAAARPGTAKARSLPAPEILLERTFARVRRAAKSIRPENTASIHQMRVEFKRYRYSAELLQPLIPGIRPAQLRRMKAFQDAAGEVQDLEVFLHRIARAIKHRKLNPTAVRSLREDLNAKKTGAIARLLRGMNLEKFKPITPTTQRNTPSQ